MDKSIKSNFDVKITEIKYDTASLTRMVSGIKKGMSPPPGVTAGGNGTYRLGYPEVLRELNIYFRRIDDIGWSSIDVREIVLNINDRSKITDKLVEILNNKLVGTITTICLNKNNWALVDNSILEI